MRSSASAVERLGKEASRPRVVALALDVNRKISPAPTRRFSFGNPGAQACVGTVSRHQSIGESAVAGDQSWVRLHAHRRPE